MSIPSDAAAQRGRLPPRPSRIRYTLSFPAPQTHYVEVEAAVPTGGRPADRARDGGVDAWLVPRARVLAARRGRRRPSAAGQARAVEKTAKNRWRVQTGGAPSVTVRYRVYGREMSVRTNFIDADFALINGAATFLTLADDAGPRPHEVALVCRPRGRRR